ncbi:MAG: 30S ribosomal protein S11 [Proteobacteria bacterium]|nr:30S ribosomal protein S11 [Pseudomonadota bacterium]MCH9757783.1 30S ribosomal protein S11 [Pseudomonadota bacterium]
MATSQSPRRKVKRVVNDAVVTITSTFNNTIITFADRSGNVLAWATTGSSGFKGARKGTPYAAQIATENAARRAQEIGVQNVDVCVRGVGAGRDSSIRALNNLGFRVASIRDVTPMPHNGCRASKRRRV